MIQTKMIPISKLEINKRQLDSVPKNPRTIKDSRYQKLLKSIKDLPEMLELMELLVYPIGKKYIILGGNMRFKALSELKYTEAPCKVISSKISKEKLKEIVIKDNVGFGEDDWGVLNADWDVQLLSDWGLVETKGSEISFTAKLPTEKKLEEGRTTHICPNCETEFDD